MSRRVDRASRVFNALSRTRVVISHWDIDGLAAAAMLTEKTRPLKVILSSITAVPRNLLKAMDIIGLDGEIYISDLNPQTSQLKDLSGILDVAREKGIRIYWIDHHEWDVQVYRLFAKYSDILWYLVDPSTVAAELVALKYGFVDRQGFYRRLIDMAVDDDFFLNRYKATIMWRRVLRWYKWETRYKALRSLLKHELEPLWMKRLYRVEVKNLYENLIREAIGRADYITTNHGLKILVFQDVDPRIHPGEVTLTAKENGLLADIYIVRYPRGVSLRSDAVDVSLIARLLGGGGHKNAAGAPGKISITSIIALLDRLEERFVNVDKTVFS